jgi:hypothetical protein
MKNFLIMGHKDKKSVQKLALKYKKNIRGINLCNPSIHVLHGQLVDQYKIEYASGFASC